MDFAPDDRARELTERARAFLDEHVLPAEPVLEEQLAAAPGEWSVRPIVRDLQAKAREQGLWNLFLPGDRGAGLTNLQYAPVAEVTGWSPRLAPAALQLRRARHRQHGGPERLRHRRSRRSGGSSRCCVPTSARRSA